jgi:signal transduction histidine kinase
MIRSRSLRSRIAVSFGVAVLCAMAFYALVAMGVFLMYQRHEAHELELGAHVSEERESVAVIQWLAGSFALLAPVSAVVAGGIGLWLARKALAPLAEAAQRAKEARAGATELLLPLRGADDEWDRLAVVLNELLHEERLSMARARAFSANAAHELRNPLAAMLGEVQVALRRERSPEEYRESLRSVQLEVSRLALLVERLLVLARADSGELRGAAVIFDLATVGAEAVEAVRARHPEAGAVLRLDASPAPARGDPLLFRRVIENLVENAIRHGGPNVEVRVAREGALVTAAVVDDGPGLSPAVRARLFERFNRRLDGGEGFGLGLAIAHALAAAQGGRLRLDDAAGPTRFVVEIPAAAAEHAA